MTNAVARSPAAETTSVAVLDERPRCQGHQLRFADGSSFCSNKAPQPGAEAIEMMRLSARVPDATAYSRYASGSRPADLVADSGIGFEERGTAEFRGSPARGSFTPLSTRTRSLTGTQTGCVVPRVGTSARAAALSRCGVAVTTVLSRGVRLRAQRRSLPRFPARARTGWRAGSQRR